MAELEVEVRPLQRAPAVPMEPVVDPAAWTASNLANDQGWVHELSESDVAELDALVASLSGRIFDVLEIKDSDIDLPTLGPRLERVANDVLDGRGLALIRGVPVERYSRLEAAIAFWCIGGYVGDPVSQNAKGHLLGHVQDLGGTTLKNPNNRGYQTQEGLPYHCDSCDVVVLMCLHPSKSGGESTVVSSLNIYNEMLKRNPSATAALTEAIYRDRRNEIPEGKDPWFQLPVFNFHDDLMTVSWQGGYIRSATRFDELPPHSRDLKDGLDLFNQLANELAYSMDFKPGDIQILHNHVTVHSRTAFEEFPEPERKRHLLRLWLGTPNGRPLSPAYRNRYGDLKPDARPAGGIIVPGTVFKAPLEAE
ncbi:MAG: TauD/TfdA family dioxygenase [Alphaproteobacteria bacterium]|nr:TauD/TfdA family dioxygenase [Alphaproteobacteria bacterium]